MGYIPESEEVVSDTRKDLADYFLKRIADWEAYGRRSQERAQRLIDRNKALTAQVMALEETLGRMLQQAPPVNRRLFQGAVL